MDTIAPGLKIVINALVLGTCKRMTNMTTNYYLSRIEKTEDVMQVLNVVADARAAYILDAMSWKAYNEILKAAYNRLSIKRE